MTHRSSSLTAQSKAHNNRHDADHKSTIPAQPVQQHNRHQKLQRKFNMSLWIYSLLSLGTIVALMVTANHVANRQIEHNRFVIDNTEELTNRFANFIIDLEQLALLLQTNNQADNQTNDDTLIPTIAMQIENNANHIDRLINQLQQGGQVKDQNNKVMFIQSLDNTANKNILSNLNLTWQRHQSQLQSLFMADANNYHDKNDNSTSNDNKNAHALNTNDAIALANFSYLSHPSIIETLNRLKQEHIQQNNYWASVVQKVFWTGFILIGGYVLWLLMYLNRQVKRSNAKLAQTAYLNEMLFATADDGLFFLDSEGRIGERQSNTLAAIMGVDKLSHRRFLNLLERRIDKDVHELSKDFINKLYQNSFTNALATDANIDIHAQNPLKSVMFLGQYDTGMQLKPLSFSFMPLPTQAQSFFAQSDERILVKVSPINSPQKDQHHSTTSTDAVTLLPQLLSINTDILTAFINRMDMRLSMFNQGINELLNADNEPQSKLNPPTKSKIKSQQDANLQPHLDFLSYTAYSMLIDVNTLPLPCYVQIIESLDKNLQNLTNKNPNTPFNHHEIANVIANVTKDFTQLTALHQQIVNIHHHLPKEVLSKKTATHPALTDKSLLLTLAKELKNETTTANAIQISSLIQFVAQQVKTQHKQIHLYCPAWDENGLSDTQRCMIYDISLQLLSNAIHHGIKPIQQRINANKTAYGQIRIHLIKTETKDGHAYELQCSDDGDGIDFDKLLQNAITQGLVDQKNAKKLSHEQVIKLLFLPQLHRQVTDSQNRGMGMQLIKHHVKALNARLLIDSQQPKYSKFRIEFTF